MAYKIPVDTLDTSGLFGQLRLFIAFPYLVGACARLDADGRRVARANSLNLLGGAIAPFVAANIVSVADYRGLGIFCFGLALFCLILAIVFSNQMDRIFLFSTADLVESEVR